MGVASWVIGTFVDCPCLTGSNHRIDHSAWNYPTDLLIAYGDPTQVHSVVSHVEQSETFVRDLVFPRRVDLELVDDHSSRPQVTAVDDLLWTVSRRACD